MWGGVEGRLCHPNAASKRDGEVRGCTHSSAAPHKLADEPAMREQCRNLTRLALPKDWSKSQVPGTF